MKVIELTEYDEKWDKFLNKYPHLVFHRPEWKKFIESTFKTELKYLAVEDNNEIELLFPIGIVHSRNFGNRLVSIPFLEYGGFAGNPKNLNLIINLIKEAYPKYDFLQVREGVPEKYLLENNFQKFEEAKRFTLELQKPEVLWEKIDKQKRKAVRKAQEMKVTVSNIGHKEIPKLYELYYNNMKKFGSPPYPKEYFVNYFTYMVDKQLAKPLGAYLDGKLIAALLGFTYKNKVHITISASDEQFLEYRPNDLLHWEFIKWAAENNFKVFDFGIARENTGHFRFKQLWNTEVKPLNNYYLFLNKKERSIINPDDPQYERKKKLFQKLPKFISLRLGKKLREELAI
ncbi:MAG: GNAT family N-acetyltransferase [Candidatus Woesearchaeota archaeon]|nr:MAG: GNAT family N-acetyltransferase [Candidatus Woesearchaeota archaeon]